MLVLLNTDTEEFYFIPFLESCLGLHFLPGCWGGGVCGGGVGRWGSFIGALVRVLLLWWMALVGLCCFCAPRSLSSRGWRPESDTFVEGHGRFV